MSIDTVSSPRSRFNIPHVNVFLNRLQKPENSLKQKTVNKEIQTCKRSIGETVNSKQRNLNM